jgi:hypothetical protein
MFRKTNLPLLAMWHEREKTRWGELVFLTWHVTASVVRVDAPVIGCGPDHGDSWPRAVLLCTLAAWCSVGHDGLHCARQSRVWLVVDPWQELRVVATERVALRSGEVVRGGWSDVLDGGFWE